MIRVLHVISAMDRGGGAQSLLMDYYRNIDKSKVQFDFVVHRFNHGEKAQYDDEITDLGGKVFLVPVDRIKHPLRYKNWWQKFFQKNPGYDIVEGHILTSGVIYLAAAKRTGCYTIAHSHSTWEKGGPWLHGFLSKIVIWPVRFFVDDFVACSVEAGMDYFGKRIVHSDRFRVVSNVIDCKRFRFSSEKREAVRNANGIRKDELLVGHVGRFTPPKNHIRLLRIFKTVHEELPSAKLILLGPLVWGMDAAARQECTRLGLDDTVIFAGLHENIEDYYSAMDVFCFPSLWEGLGMVAVEAQINGLPCVVSDAVPPAADIGAGLFEPMSLKKSDEEWAEVILAQRKKKRDADCTKLACQAGYDAVTETQKLQEYYLTRRTR